MELYQNKYRTDSIRLKGWDYRRAGAYFVTICTKDRQHFFGEIRNGIMGLSHIGVIANWIWLQIPNQFPHVELDEYVVMPNHVHGIIWINNVDTDNKSTIRRRCHGFRPRRDAINRVSTGTDNGINAEIQLKSQPGNRSVKPSGGITGQHNPMNSDGNLGQIIRWYKGRCSFEIHQRNYSGFAWQGRFWDHIIRNDRSLNRIREYIINNPLRWESDRFYNQQIIKSINQ